MIDKQFWMDAKVAWISSETPQVNNVQTSSGGKIDPILLNNPWERVLFNDVEIAQTIKSMMNGGDIVLKVKADVKQGAKPDVKPVEEPLVAPPRRPALDADKFEEEMDKGTLSGYTEASKLLVCCELPKEMDGLYQELISRMPVLQDAITKFEGVYQPDMEQFYDYYIPEALQLTSSYLEYLEAGIGDEIISETEEEIIDAVSKLIIAVNDKIDEIYKFASIEIKAKAKALESLMSQDGYVDSKFKFN